MYKTLVKLVKILDWHLSNHDSKNSLKFLLQQFYPVTRRMQRLIFI
jgi:hypothetical protein